MFERLYKEEGAILDLLPKNLVYNKKLGLVCFDVQKVHKAQYQLYPHNSPMDIFYILNNILEVNR